ncbi:MAG: hypothetical protein BM558_12995 [Roseobacter sp. MedPE-SW]|nr:MAG: hypothetical protein BM558_12995 [Roseobacter sp. MedPE-SW]
MDYEEFSRQAASMKVFVSYLVPRGILQVALHYLLWMIFIISLYLLQKFFFDGGLEYGYVQPLRTVFVIATPCLLIGLNLASKLEAQKDEISRLARTDVLTGLLNRGAMDAVLASDLSDMSGSLLLIDIDHFKSVNDDFGHAAGDECLRAVAKFLRLVLPKDVELARWGGEEFVALVRRQNVSEIAPFANKLVRGFTLPIEGHNRQTKITFSIGVAAISEVGPVDALLKLADTRLYLAKSWGRAQWVGPEAEPLEP